LNSIAKPEKQCHGEKIVAAMGEELDREPDSEMESQFYQRYGANLVPFVNEAREGLGMPALICCKSRLALISLLYFAPQICELKNCILAVPGTYAIDAKVVIMLAFPPSTSIVNQQRQLVIVGSHGEKYSFELKCQPDLRIDQSVLQFFEFTNMHIKNRLPNDLRSLNIHCCPVISLSEKATLVQFVRDTESMEEQIYSYHMEHNPKSRLAQEPINRLTHLQPLDQTRDSCAPGLPRPG
jgi:PI-3-kinase-related kinase SMG-1